MKARIKATGEIVRLSEYTKIILDMYDGYGSLIEFKPEDVELIPDKEINSQETDWDQVRVQASIGAMQVIIGIIGKNNYNSYKDIAAYAVGYADALIEELKK